MRAEQFDDVSFYQTFVLQPLIFLGGVFYSAALLPEPFQTLTHFDPVYYMIALVRYGFLGYSEVVDRALAAASWRSRRSCCSASTTACSAAATGCGRSAPSSLSASSAGARSGVGDIARMSAAAPQIDIVIPVYNEQAVLERSVRRLHRYLAGEFPFSWRIVIADNASTDDTALIARRLSSELPRVEHRRLEAKGRGRALRAAWSASRARVVAYMDVDLSTDLRALLPLVAPLLSGHSDVAIGSRLSRGARVVRGPKRELISRGYNVILRTALRARFSDAQCGFKAVRADAVRKLLPEVRDEGWFFDTELLVLAQRRGLRIHEVPVDWIDDPDSRVDIVRTAWTDLKGVARLAAGGAGRALHGGRRRCRRSPTRCCSCCCARRSARPAPTGSRWPSRPSATPRRTGASPSGCAAGPACCASTRSARWCSC